LVLALGLLLAWGQDQGFAAAGNKKAGAAEGGEAGKLLKPEDF
jgi:hypothetical protein